MTKLNYRKKLGYASGDVASNIIYQGLNLFILFFWTNYAGLSPATAGFILLISRVFDGFTDIWIGTLVDKTKSKHGKARPWILYIALPFALIACLTFWAPQSNSNAINVVYAFVSYNMMMLTYTAINIPYGVLSARITHDQVERGTLGVLRSVAAGIGTVIVSLVVPIMLLKDFPFWMIFLSLGILGSLLFLITFITTKEIKTSQDDVVPLNFKNNFKLLLKNKPWIFTLFAGICLFAGMTVKSSSTAYFAVYILQSPQALITLALAMIPGMVLGYCVAPFAFKKIGKIRTASYFMFLYGILSIGFYYLLHVNLQLNILIVFIAFNAFCFSIASSGYFAIVTDTIEYGEFVTNVRIEGVIYSGASIGTKLGAGIGAFITGLILTMVAFDPNLTQQSETVNTAIEWLFLWIPSILYVCFGILMSFNQVDKMTRSGLLSK